MHRYISTSSVLAAFAFTGIATASLTVDLGTIRQIAPRPTLEYAGAYSNFISSRVDTVSPRTIVGFDLFGIMQQLGGSLALVGVRVRDGGGNSYGTWSPGADIDLIHIVGAPLDGTTAMSYAGVVAQHLGETDAVLRARVSACDSVSGDQHYNVQHFVSLGAGGTATMSFSGFLHSGPVSGGGGSGSEGGFGPGSSTGGGGESQPAVYGGLLITQGMMLELSEAGLGEKYGVELLFETASVPAPGAIALLALAGFVARRRR